MGDDEDFGTGLSLEDQRHYFKVALAEHSDPDGEDRRMIEAIASGATRGPAPALFESALAAWALRKLAPKSRGRPVNRIRDRVIQENFEILRSDHGMSRARAFDTLADWAGCSPETIRTVVCRR